VDIERGGDAVGEDNAEKRKARHVLRDGLHKVLEAAVLEIVVLVHLQKF